MEQGYLNTQGLENSNERKSLFEKVVFGHNYKDFDRDQFVAYYLALKAGVITLDTPVGFTDKVESHDLKDTKVLVLEGTRGEVLNKNTIKSGNFDNGDNDDPAAWMVYQAVQRGLSELDNKEQIKELARAFRSIENSNKEISPDKPLKFGSLDQYVQMTTAVFYGYKHDCGEDYYKFIKDMVLMLDTFLGEASSEKKEKLLQERYNTYAHSTREFIKDNKKELALALKNESSRFEYKVTNTGKRLAFFDTRGIKASTSASKILTDYIAGLGKEVPDLCCIFADSTSESRGVKVMISVPREKAALYHEYDIGVDLKDRLNYIESLFGSGFESDYGGHQHFIASDRLLGTAIEPDMFWYALNRYYNTERYTKDEFSEYAKRFAYEYCGTKHANIISALESDSAGKIPDRYFEVCVGDMNEIKKIRIKEGDIPYYEKVFNDICHGDKAHFLEILGSQTDLSYPVEIRKVKSEMAYNSLLKSIESQEIVSMLEALSDMVYEDIERLSIRDRIGLIGAISQSPLGVDLVWNPYQMAYRITSYSAPNYIYDSLQKHALAKFQYDSLTKIVDKQILEKTVQDICLKKEDVFYAKRLLGILVVIADSDSYKNIDREQGWFDSVLSGAVTLLGFLEESKELNSEEVGRFLESIFSVHGEYAKYAKIQIPKFSKIFTRYGIQNESDSRRIFLQIPSNPGSYMEFVPDSEFAENVNRSIQDNGSAVTGVVHLGRGLDEDAYKKGFYGDSSIVQQDPYEIFSMRIPGAVDLLSGHKEARVIVNSIMSMINESMVKAQTITGQSVKLRIVFSGVPLSIMLGLGALLQKNELLDRVVPCFYNMQAHIYKDERMDELF
jgi:hypothetical protein